MEQNVIVSQTSETMTENNVSHLNWFFQVSSHYNRKLTNTIPTYYCHKPLKLHRGWIIRSTKSFGPLPQKQDEGIGGKESEHKYKRMKTVNRALSEGLVRRVSRHGMWSDLKSITFLWTAVHLYVAPWMHGWQFIYGGYPTELLVFNELVTLHTTKWIS